MSNFRSGRSLRKIAVKRRRRHGLVVVAAISNRRGKRRRWLVHQLAGEHGYRDTDLP